MATCDAFSVLQTTPGRRNFQRLTRLLIAGGTSVLREVFDSVHPPSSLPSVLSQPTVQTKLKGSRITKSEWDRLYPSPTGSYGKSSDFDITLLSRLLRSICGLPSPSSGDWGKLPAPDEKSVSDDLARVKVYRNTIYGHNSGAMKVSDEEFNDLWLEVSEALIRLASSVSAQKGREWERAIEKLQSDPLTPEDEKNTQELKAWYRNDCDTKEMLETLHTELAQVNEGISRVPGTSLTIIINGQSAVQTDGTRLPTRSVDEIMIAVATGYLQSIPPRSPEDFNNFRTYLSEIRRLLISREEVSSLRITVKCTSLDILQDLWQDYKSGELNKAAQRYLVQDEILRKYNLKHFRLVTTINAEEYRRCREELIEMEDAEKRKKELLRLLPEWEEKRKNTVKVVRSITRNARSEYELTHRTTLYAVCGALGGTALTVGSLLLAPFTGFTSLPGVGAGAALVGGAVAVSSSVKRYYMSKWNKEAVRKALDEDRKSSEEIKSLLDHHFENLTLTNPSITLDIYTSVENSLRGFDGSLFDATEAMNEIANKLERELQTVRIATHESICSRAARGQQSS